MVNLGNLYTEFRKKNFTFCFRNKFLNFWQCLNAKYLKFMCITLDLHTSNLDLHRSRVDVCRSSLDLHTSIPGLSILSVICDNLTHLFQSVHMTLQSFINTGLHVCTLLFPHSLFSVCVAAVLAYPVFTLFHLCKTSEIIIVM